MNTKLILQKETMTSLEIAEFFDKQHKNVLRDIENTFRIIRLTGLTYESSYKDDSGKSNKIYILDEDLTMLISTGYSVELRWILIKTFRDLKNKLRILEQEKIIEAINRSNKLLEENKRINAQNIIKNEKKKKLVGSIRGKKFHIGIFSEYDYFIAREFIKAEKKKLENSTLPINDLCDLIKARVRKEFFRYK